MDVQKGNELKIGDSFSQMVRGKFGFIDGGCGSGGSLEYCEKVFGRGPGIGFDLSSQKIELAQAAGYAVYQADMASVSLPKNCVSFVSFLDVLEHLPDIQTAEKIIKNMGTVAKDFIFIRHPSFEDVEYLKGYGLKIDWTDWQGHPNPMLLSDFDSMFRRLGFPSPAVFAQSPIKDSNHPAIVPLDAPTDTIRFDREKHGPKAVMEFNRKVYSQFDIFVCLNPDLSREEWECIVTRVILARKETERLSFCDMAGPPKVD